jgi:hypothetical protein
MEVYRPDKRIFWEDQNQYSGVADAGVQIVSKDPITVSEDGSIFPPLPPVGTFVNIGEIYSYNDGAVEVMQSHNITNFPPEDVPALFLVYRANSSGAEWIAGEEVIAGDERTYQGDTYRCIQSHVTQEGWEPPNVPALWELVQGENPNGDWQPNTSYSIGDIVTYQGVTYECIQAHTSIVGWEPPNVPALWVVVP